jgi:hypothetical protein
MRGGAGQRGVVLVGGCRASSRRKRSLFIDKSSSHTLFSLSLSSLARAEDSVIFSRAITQIPNDQETRSFFRFLALSFHLSFCVVCVCVCASARGRAREDRKKSFRPLFRPPLVRFLCFFITSFSAERPLCGAIMITSVGRQETANSSATVECLVDDSGRPSSLSPHRRAERAQEPMTVRAISGRVFGCGMLVDPNSENDR